MGVQLRTGNFSHEIGSSDFLGAFFDTIRYHLTGGVFDKKYPTVLEELYNGKLAYESLMEAERELKEIKQRLEVFVPSKIIWDLDDLTKRPPWENSISDDITDLSNYFVTSDGKDLFEVLFEAIHNARIGATELFIE